MDDTVDGKEVRSPEEWRIFLHAADLGLLYPLGPTAEAAHSEVRAVEPEAEAAPQSERKLSRTQKALLEEIKEVCGSGYARLRTVDIMNRVAKSRGRNGGAVPGRDTFDRALGRRKS